MSITIQVRRDTAANWTSSNPTLSAGEPGFETDTGKIKFGDGSTAWTGLAYTGVTLVSSVFARTGAVVAVTGDYGGVVSSFLTGATQASRYVGATTSGAPVSGTFAVGDFVVARDGHMFVCTTAGSPGTWTDVASAGSAFATPAVALGSAAAAGAAGTVIRSDSTIAAFDTTAPTTQAFGDSAAVGTAAFAARRDHKHAMPATPVTSIAKTGSSALTGAVTLSAGSGVDLTQASQDISIAVSGASGFGLLSLVYRYTVTGSDKASIDTGSDTPDAGSNDWTNGDVLELYMIARTDETANMVDLACTFNNDTSSNHYFTQYIRTVGTTVSSLNFSLASFQPRCPGASLTAGVFGFVALTVPDFAGTVAQKVGQLAWGTTDSGSASSSGSGSIVWNQTSAITRFAVTPNTAAKKLKVGSQLLIYKRLAS